KVKGPRSHGRHLQQDGGKQFQGIEPASLLAAGASSPGRQRFSPGSMQSWRAVNVVTISQGITAATRPLAIFHSRLSPPGRVRQTGRGTDDHAQGFSLITPQSKLLECDDTLSAEWMKRRLASALKKFDPTDEVPTIEEGRKDAVGSAGLPWGDRADHSQPKDG